MNDTKEKYIHRTAKLIMNKAMPFTKEEQQKTISHGRLKEEHKLLKIKK